MKCNRNHTFCSLFSEQGQSTVIVMTFLPLILLLLFSLGSTSLFLGKKAKELSTCRKGMFEIHSQMLRSIDELKKYNPEARRLQKAEELLKAAKRTGGGGNPVVVGGIAVTWGTLKALQAKLRAKQEGIKKSFKSYSLQKKHEIFLSLKTKKPEATKQSLNLPVFPKPITSLSPTYHVNPGAKHLSRLKISWSGTTKDQCQGEIILRNLKWKVALK